MRTVSRSATTSHPVAAPKRPHHNPAFAGSGSGDETNLYERHMKPEEGAVRLPGSREIDASLDIRTNSIRLPLRWRLWARRRPCKIATAR